MIKYLDILYDLLNFEPDEKQSFLAIGEAIIQHKDKKLITYHRLGFVFEGFRELIHDQLSLEEFMVLGDVSSTRPLWKKDTLSTLELLQSSKALEKIEQGSMLILDEIVFLTLSRIEQENVKQVLELRGILLLMC